MRAPIPENEAERLRQLRDLVVLDSEPEELFDSLTRLASQVCGVPIALVSLIDSERQWFKANVGLPGVNETPRDVAFCAHAIASDEPLLEVRNASADPRFFDNPFVAAEAGIRFYAGAPLVLPGGHRIGTLCVIDHQERKLDAAQAAMLTTLARIASEALVMRRDLINRALAARSQYETALRDSASFLRRTGQVAGVGGWQLDLANPALTWSPQTRKIHEVGSEYIPTLDRALEFYQPEDRPGLAAAIKATIAGGPAWDMELAFTTAAGRQIWVRTQGEAEFEQGLPVRLVGALQDITERKRLEQHIIDNERFLHQVTDGLPQRIAYVDRERRYRFVNDAHLRSFGKPREQLLGRTRVEITGEVSVPELRQGFDRVLKGEMQHFEFDEAAPDGSTRRLDCLLLPDLGPDGTVRGVFATTSDITAEAAARREARLQSATLRAVTEATPAIISVVNADMHYRMVNSAFERWIGLPRDQIVGRHVNEILSGQSLTTSQAWIARALAGEAVQFEREDPTRGDGRNMAMSYSPLINEDGGIDGFIAVGQDITLHRQEQRRLKQLSEHDALTGLLNRAGFERRAALEIEEGRGARMALLYVDLDHFKPVNDHFGHPVGDQVLQQFAQRLQAAIRPSDVVARLGGDEFAVLLFDVREAAHAQAAGEHVINAACTPFLIAGHEIAIGASVGVAFAVKPAEGWPELVARADAQLYRAKEAGRGQQAGLTAWGSIL